MYGAGTFRSGTSLWLLKRYHESGVAGFKTKVGNPKSALLSLLDFSGREDINHYNNKAADDEGYAG